MSEAHTGPIRILHAEDDPDLASLVADRLPEEDDRFVIDSAGDADAALEALAGGEYECIISDYDMPRATGIDLLERVREFHPELPFILYTGKGSEEIASEAVSAGVSDYVQKAAGSEDFALLANRVRNAVEQYRAEGAMRRTRKRFRTLVEEATDVTLVVDGTGTITHVTGAAEAILGRGAEALVGSDGFEPIHQGDRDRVATEFAALTDDPDGRRTVEFRYHRADGETIWLEARGRNLLDDPVVGGIVVYARDVTDRKERERHLERYRTMIDAMPDSAAVYDAEGRFVLVNEFLADGVGVEPDEMVGRESTLIQRLRESEPGDPYRELLAGERDELRGELPSVFRNTEDIWEYRLTRVELEDGAPGAVAFSRDVTERVEDERRLERYRQLVNALEDPVAAYDTTGRYQLVNRTLADRFGCTPDELRGQPSRLVERLRDRPEGDLFGDLVDGERGALSFELESPSLGPGTTMEYHLTRIEENGHCTGVVAISRDITERLRREAELETTNERLEQFAGTVSHDLRNPLNVAEGRLELAREERDDEHLAAIAAAHERMRTLIDDLLALAREARGAVEPEPVDLESLLRTCWANADGADATLVVEDAGTVRADPDRLRQLIENLLGNAIQHAGSAVTVTVGTLEDGFYVEDDGPGIPADERESVFEAGHSSDPAGTGFGLNIVQRMAESHGWTVEVVDAPTGGARFEITGVRFIE